MQKKSAFVLGAIIIGLAGIFYSKFFPKKEIHYNAGFKVYVDGKMQDFSGLKYMSIKPCGKEEEEREENEPIQSYESVVFFVGKVDEKKLKNSVTKDQIKKAEKNNETC